MKTTMFILLIFLYMGCENVQITDIAVYNHAFDGTVRIDSHEIYLDLGECFTLIVEEGMHTIDLVGTELIETPMHSGYIGLSDEVFIRKGHNEHIIKYLTKNIIFIEP